jgi:hypothetical protein
MLAPRLSIRCAVVAVALSLSDLALAQEPGNDEGRSGRAGAAGLVRLAQVPDAKTDPKKKAPASAKQEPAAAAAAAPIAVPPPEVLLLMVRTSIIAIDQANKTNNYSVLRALSGPTVQALTAEQLGEKFADLRNKQIDLAPTIVVQPQLIQQPAVSKEGALQLVGFFPTQPLQVHFQMVMQPVKGFWRLAGMTINVVPPGQTAVGAPTTPPASAPQKKDAGGKADKK